MEQKAENCPLGFATLDMLGDDEIKKMTPYEAIDRLSHLWVLVVYDGAMLVLQAQKGLESGDASLQVFRRVGIVSQWAYASFRGYWDGCAGDKLREWTDIRTITVV